MTAIPHDERMEVSRRTWTAAIRLAVVVSIVAVGFAVAATQLGDIPQAAIVIPVIVVAFTASWIQTERIHRRGADSLVILPARRRSSHAG